MELSCRHQHVDAGTFFEENGNSKLEVNIMPTGPRITSNHGRHLKNSSSYVTVISSL